MLYLGRTPAPLAESYLEICHTPADMQLLFAVKIQNLSQIYFFLWLLGFLSFWEEDHMLYVPLPANQTPLTMGSEQQVITNE